MAEQLNNLSQVLLHSSGADLNDKSPGGSGYRGATIKELGDFFATGLIDISGKEDVANRGAASGYAPLNSSTKVSNIYLYDNLGSRTVEQLTVNDDAVFKEAAEFRKTVDFNGYVNFNNYPAQFYSLARFNDEVYFGAGTIFESYARFDANANFRDDVLFQTGEVRLSHSCVAVLMSEVRDSLNKLPTADGQVLLSTSNKLRWGTIETETDTGTYTVITKVGYQSYVPASSAGTYAVTGDVVKCSGYFEADGSMYIQNNLFYNTTFSAFWPIRLTTLPFPAAEIEHNIGYNITQSWVGSSGASGVRGGTLGTWCVTDATGEIYGSGAIVGVLDYVSPFQGSPSYQVNIHFVGPTAQFEIITGQILKFNFEYIKS